MSADLSTTSEAMKSSHIVCSVRNLTVTYQTDAGDFPALHNVNLDIQKNQITAVIGESGSGKSTLALAMLNGIALPGRVTGGTISLSQHGDVLALRGKALRRLRGPIVGTVFQASQNAMNPLRRIGKQILDLGRSHGYKDPRILLREAQLLAKKMSMDPDRVLTAYPHQLSGGMRQRLGIIMALVLHPEILLLDEPTTALDLLTQSAVLQIIQSIHRERQLTTLLITHDMGVVAEVADTVVVLYAGRVMEEGRTAAVLRHPGHPYTRALIKAIPRLTGSLDQARPLEGSPPDLTMIPRQGCVFRQRCRYRMALCDTESPSLKQLEDGHLTACHWEGQSDD